MDRGHVTALWAGIFCLVLVAHGLSGFAWLTRSLPALEDRRAAEPAFELDLVGPAPATNVGDPILEPAPDVPEPTVPSSEGAIPTAEAAPAPPVEAVVPPQPPQLPATPPRRAAPSNRTSVREPSPAEQAREKARERERVEARREATEDRRRAAAQRQAREAGASPSAGRAPVPGASAAASAAWRSQIVGILRGRFAGGSRGMASVTFSVGRGGQITGARLTASSGDARLDAAALAAFRGTVPAPPAGYVGPLTFNIRLGVR